LSSASAQIGRSSGSVGDAISGDSVSAASTSTDRDPRRPGAAELLAALSDSDKEAQEAARRLFLDQGYLNEAISELRSSVSIGKRAAAARALGIVGSLLTTPHLIAALFDRAPEVRCAAAEALHQLQDPDVNLRSLNAFLGTDSVPKEGSRLTETEHESLWVEGGAWERSEEGNHHLKDPLLEAEGQGLRDREPTLVPCAEYGLPSAALANLHSADPSRRVSALFDVARSGEPDYCTLIISYFDDPSPEVRDAAAVALRDLDPRRAAEFFMATLETASPDRCRNIGDAMIASGLAAEAINDLTGEDRERAYNALGMLFVMAKVNAVQPLVQAIEDHESFKVRSAAIKLLNSSGHMEVAEAAVRRRLRI
jgi:HEAT repeat protein